MANYLYNGIDVSKHQGTIDWKQVAASGVDFVMIRAGYGRLAQQEDQKFKVNIEGAWAAGIRNIGVYWYSYMGSVDDMRQEIQACLTVIKPYKDKITLGAFADVEYESSILAMSTTNRTEACKVFCETMKNAGFKCGVYASKDFLDNKLKVSSLPSYASIWVAQYNSTCTYSGKHVIWQYSSTGKVPGISGNVDMDKATAELIPAQTKWEKDSVGWKYGGLKSAWKKIDDVWYWFDETGHAVTGWHKIKNVWYYFLTLADAQKTGLKECSCFSLDKS